MASEDVIELGSSEDEAEPAPKKKKPLPNAMVHIPTKLPGLTIRPAKVCSSNTGFKNVNISNKSINVQKGILTKPIMISKKVNFPTNVNKQIPNIRPVCVPINKNFPKNPKIVQSVTNTFSINPVSIAKNLPRPQIVKNPLGGGHRRPKKPLDKQAPKILNTLPPGITIRPLSFASSSGMRKRHNNGSIKNSVGDVLTVEIDDEETPENSSQSPQWYLRPEDQVDDLTEDKNHETEIFKTEDKLSLEVQNNKEPEPKISNFVEIVIQDSPIKPQPKNVSETADDAITIEDSPIKPIKTKHTDIDSDSEQTSKYEKQSKKKLNYPKSSKASEVVEIEIDISDSLNENKNNIKNANNTTKITVENKVDDNVTKLDKEISPDTESINQSDKKSEILSNENTKVQESNQKESKGSSGDSEFHSVYQNFIDICFKLENSDDMKRIVDKKIKAYYKQCPKDYVESEEFLDMVSSKISAIKSSPDKMYLYIKDIVDELNLQRKLSKTVVVQKTEDTAVKESETFLDGEEQQFDRKRQKQIRKLEKTIKKLHRAIQKLEEQEVDFDDDEDSVYLLTERYKDRMVRVHAKFCQLINTKMPSEPRIHLEVRPGRPMGPVRKLEKWINKKVPIGTPLPFPDFHDVLRCVREANDEDRLGWNEVDIMEEARDLFTSCGKKLQRRRQENEWRLAASRITQEVDPAEASGDLKKKLDENKLTAVKKEAELLNAYVVRQNQLKLEGEEIGDKEAEESPDESDEEELTEEPSSMENKQKRKQRLKRLIHEKNTKSEEKENKEKTQLEDSNKQTVTDEINNDSKDQKEPEKSEMKPVDEVKITLVQDNAAQENISITKEGEFKDNTEGTSNQVEAINSDSELEKVDTDTDEMNLLQKLHSDIDSRASNDSDSPISISDSMDSDSDTENKNVLSDVISISNSSYSESELNEDNIPIEIERPFSSSTKPKIEDIAEARTDKVFTTATSRDNGNSKNVENILSSSDDENSKKIIDSKEDYINLKDDEITISETTIIGESKEDKNINADNKNLNATSIQECYDKNDSYMSVDEVEDQENDQQKNGDTDVAIQVSYINDCVEMIESPKKDTDTQRIIDVKSIENDPQFGDFVNLNENQKNDVDTQIIAGIKTIESTDSQVAGCNNKNESSKNYVDIQITDLHSIDSVDSQVGECDNINESPKNDDDNQSITDLNSVESIDSPAGECVNANESSKNDADTESIKDIKSIESVDSNVGDCIIENESSKNEADNQSVTDIKSIESIDSQVGDCYDGNMSPKNDVDIQSVTDIKSIESGDSQVGDCVNANESQKNDAETHIITDLNSIDSESQDGDCVNTVSKSPKNDADTQSITELNSVESLDSQIGDCKESESPRNDGDAQSVTDINSVESVDSQVEQNKDDLISIEDESANTFVTESNEIEMNIEIESISGVNIET